MSFSPLSQAVNIFFSYAISSSKDKRLLKRLMTHLSALRRLHRIDTVHDSNISAGHNITQAIETYLRSADIIVLLISADFLESERCYELEMHRALELSQTGTARIIPVILSPTDWEILPLAHYSPLPAGGTPISLKRDIDDALSEVARGIRKVVEEVASRVKKVHTYLAPSKSPLHHYPYRQNAFFTDRETILTTLFSTFTFSQVHQTRILELHGLGGIGKTQIALQYLHLASSRYQTVLWLNASSREQFNAEVSTLAEKLALPETNRANEEQLYATIKRWLQNQTTWLLVLDQLDDVTLIDTIIPTRSSGHVLLTTRTRITDDVASVISIPAMDTDASVSLILQRAGIIPAGTAPTQVPPETIRLATTIAEAMDGFPLALDQAGAYLEETGCDLHTYLALFQQERAALLNRRGRTVRKQNHPDSVTITLTLAIEQVTQQQPINLHLLHLLAFLQPDAIPYELLVDGADELNEPLRSLAARPLALNDALADLHNYALIYHLADTTMLRIHRIIQAVLIDSLPRRQQRQWASQAIRLVNRVFPEVHFATREACERYLPQAQHCATLIADFQLTFKEGALLLQRLGICYYQKACYREAETCLLQALQLLEKQQQATPQEIAQTLNALGLLYHRQARYQDAETVLLRALELNEQAFGPASSHTAESLYNLAVLYGSQSHYQQAEHFYLRVLAIDEQISGSEHPATAKTLNNLGMLLFLQGKYQQAETLYRRALTIYEQALPSNHPDLTYPLNGLGALAESRGHYQQAEDYFQRVLTIREQAFEENHPEIAHALNKLADIYETQGKDQQAETFYLRALDICEQVLGADHPDTALFLNNLAFLADRQKQYQQAEQYYQRALHIYEQAHGEDHPTVADVLNNLGVFYLEAGDNARAEPLLQRALTVREQILGSTHPATAQSLSNLANLRAAQQAYQEAEAFYQQALALRVQALGPTHPDAAHTRQKYIALLEHLHRYKEAAILRQEEGEPPPTDQ